MRSVDGARTHLAGSRLVSGQKGASSGVPGPLEKVQLSLFWKVRVGRGLVQQHPPQGCVGAHSRFFLYVNHKFSVQKASVSY